MEAPLANAFKSVGESTIAQIVSFGALAGLTTVMLILMLGQARIFFAMSRDHLLPPLFAKVSERRRVPYRTTIATGVAVAAVAFSLSLTTLAELVNIGTLFAFVLVAIGVVVLRRTRPDLERAFRTALVPVVPVLSVLASLWLMLNLPGETWVRFGSLDGARAACLLHLRSPPEPTGERSSASARRRAGRGGSQWLSAAAAELRAPGVFRLQ